MDMRLRTCNVKDLGIDGRILLKWMFWKWGRRLDWSGWGIETGSWLLWLRLWIFGLHKSRRISWVAVDRLSFQEGLCSVELFSYHLLITVPVLLLPAWSQAHLIRAGCCTSFPKWLFRCLSNKGTKGKGAHSSASAVTCILVVCGFEYMPHRRPSCQDIGDYLSPSR